MRKTSCFCPGHVTLLFTIRDADPDPLKKGSRGIGFSIRKGTHTQITFNEGSRHKVNIFVNGILDPAPVSREVTTRFLKLSDRQGELVIKHEIEVPQKAGFGASGAGAFSTALALNEVLDCELSRTKCGQIAHEVEVKHKTGLGDVIGQFYGGFEMRIKEGAPGIGQLKNIKMDPDFWITCASMGTLDTKEVLTNQHSRQKIMAIGDELLEKLTRQSNPTLDQMFSFSKEFARQTGLLPPELDHVLEKLEKNGCENSSMIMLGKSICCISDRSSIPQVKALIQSCFSTPITIFETQIDETGARLQDF